MINEWSCHICGEVRPDSKISVRSHDKSEEHNLPYGTFKENVRYCNDKHDCIEESRTYSHLSKVKVEDIMKKNIEKVNDISNKAAEDYSNKNEFMKKIGKFFAYFIAISFLGSFLASIGSDKTFLNQLFMPWLVPVRLVLAFILFKLSNK